VYEALFAKLAKQEQEAWERREAGGCWVGRGRLVARNEHSGDPQVGGWAHRCRHASWAFSGPLMCGANVTSPATPLQSPRHRFNAAAGSDSDDGGGGGSAPSFPGFGTSQSDVPAVSAFYTHWSHFTTCRNFSWADMYNPAAAPNR
jgi:hypothetical protein